MIPLHFSQQQEEVIQLSSKGSVFIQGLVGCGKTTAAIERLVRLLHNGINAETVLVLVPQRTLAEPYYQALRKNDLPAGGLINIQTLGGLAQRMLNLFWPLLAGEAGFAHPNNPPVFLTLETAQYYLAHVANPLLEEGYFESITIDRNRLFSQILDNLNKAAVMGFPHTSIAERLKSAWSGEPARNSVYDQAQTCAIDFRRFCFENNLLDFSLQLELFNQFLWPSLLCRQYLINRFRHLIFDNVEEDVPVVHDILRQWIPEFESALLIIDEEGGYRSFLGADPLSGESLQAVCQQKFKFSHSFITSKPLIHFQISLSASLNRVKDSEISSDISNVYTLRHNRFCPLMIDDVSLQINDLVHNQGIPPAEIVIIAPFLSDSLRFSLMNRLKQLQVDARSHRPSRSLREEPATHCLITLAQLAHPEWKLHPSQYDVSYSFMQAITGLDLVRADLLTKVVYHPHRFEAGLSSFDQIIPQMQQRITYLSGERYESLRLWFQEYQQGNKAELDIFLSKLFGEVLSQPGYNFHINFDSAAVTARLIESIQKFRQVTGTTIQSHKSLSIGEEYIQMVKAGVVAAQYIQSGEEFQKNAVLIAPAYTYLMSNRPVSYQFWLDIGSLGWWERLYQPLTHPFVLSRQWAGNEPWTDVHEVQRNTKSLVCLVNGLIRRCRNHIYLYTTGVNEQGEEQRGPLLMAFNIIIKRLIAAYGKSHV